MEHKRSIVLFLLVLVTIIETSTGASPPPPSTNLTCITQLLMCQGGTAETNCCNALKNVYDTQKDCLCLVVNGGSAAGTLGLNGTQISDLLVECGIAKNATDVCSAAPSSPFSPGSPLLPFLSPPVGVFSSPPPPNDASVPYNSMRIGLSSFASVLLFIFFGY